MDAREQAGDGRPLGGRDAPWAFASQEEAQAALEEVARYCAHRCPIRLKCAEEACRLYRVEGEALHYLREGEAAPAREVIAL